MNRFWKVAIVAAGLAAISAPAGADDARRPISLTSFGAAQTLSAYQLSNAGLIALNAPGSFSRNDFSAAPFVLPSANSTLVPRQNFAASMPLSAAFALDSGFNVDLAQRFDNYGALQSPLLDMGNVIGLANGGVYAGATWMPAPSLHVRVGADLRNDRMDSFSFNPLAASGNLPLAFDASQSRSLLAGISWNMSDWADLGVTAMHSDQSGVPFGAAGALTNTSQISTNALNLAAHVKLGDSWVTTASASLASGLSQLDHSAATPQADGHAYSITVAKHGVFGDDALGFSFSRPMPGVLDNGFDMVAASGDLPPVLAANGRFSNQTPETDLQLGYVTMFDGGAVALQANAAYQMNYQGQTGTNSLSVLSRAKIKF